jgi:hypothetical protein
MTSEHFFSTSKKGRGMAKASLRLIDAMYEIAEAAQPITGRGVGYKLFTRGLIPSMATKEMAKVYRFLTIGRENGTIPWEWIVDESRSLERRAQYDDPWDFSHIWQSYRRDRWNHQPHRVEVWSEKGTVRGVLSPVLREYGVGFRVMHGFASATVAHDVACRPGHGRPEEGCSNHLAQNCDNSNSLCINCGKRPRPGALSRCKRCLKAATDAELRHRRNRNKRDWEAPLDRRGT